MRIPSHIRIMPGQVPVKLETIEGQAQWRGVTDFEHGTLCRAFGLDPVRFYFDLPSSVRGIGSNSAGAGGHGTGNRVVNGYAFMRGREEPWGKITVIKAGDKIRDDDPQDMRSFYDLSRTERR